MKLTDKEFISIVRTLGKYAFFDRERDVATVKRILISIDAPPLFLLSAETNNDLEEDIATISPYVVPPKEAHLIPDLYLLPFCLKYLTKLNYDFTLKVNKCLGENVSTKDTNKFIGRLIGYELFLHKKDVLCLCTVQLYGDKKITQHFSSDVLIFD